MSGWSPSICRGRIVQGLMSMKATKEAVGSVEKVDGTGAISDQGRFQVECLKHLYLQAGQNWLIAQDISLHSSCWFLLLSVFYTNLYLWASSRYRSQCIGTNWVHHVLELVRFNGRQLTQFADLKLVLFPDKLQFCLMCMCQMLKLRFLGKKE